MNKAIRSAVLILLGLLCASTLLSQTTPLEEEKTQHALALMQPSPIQHSGRNAWVALITWAVPNLSPVQRQALADDYADQIRRWHDAYIADYLADKMNPNQPVPRLPGKRDLPSGRDSLLCGFATRVTDCLATVRQQPQVIGEALAPYTDVLEQVAELANYDHYYSPLPTHGNLQWPDLRFMRLPLSAHALTYTQGDSQSALIGLCRDAQSGRMLLRHSSDLPVAMIGQRILADSVEMAAQIIAELPLDTALPAICDRAFALLSAEDISLCPAMRGEFAFMRSYIEMEKQRLEHQAPRGKEKPSDWDHLILIYAQNNGATCLPQTQQTLFRDEKFALPKAPVSPWLEQCQKDNAACMMAQMNRPDYSDYLHRMQDTAAQLQMMQVLLWLRHQPSLPQSLTNNYLQAAVPVDLYTSTQRAITLSENGRALEVPAYSERATEPLRLPLPQALH